MLYFFITLTIINKNKQGGKVKPKKIDFKKIKEELDMFINGELKLVNSEGVIIFVRISGFEIVEPDMLRINVKWAAQGVGKIYSQPEKFIALNCFEVMIGGKNVRLKLFDKENKILIINTGHNGSINFKAAGDKSYEYLDVNEVVGMTFGPETMGMSETELEYLDKDMAESAKTLNALDMLTKIRNDFKLWGKDEQYSVLDKTLNCFTSAMFGMDNNNAEIHIVLANIKVAKDVVQEMREWGNEKQARELEESLLYLESLCYPPEPLEALTEEMQELWEETFAKCHQIALKNGDNELAEKISKYIGIKPLDDSEFTELKLIAKECRKLLGGGIEVCDSNPPS